MGKILWRSLLWICAVGVAFGVLSSSLTVVPHMWSEYQTAAKVPSTHDKSVVGTWTAKHEERDEVRTYLFLPDGRGSVTFPYGGQMPFTWGTANGEITIRHPGHHGHLAPTYPYRIGKGGKSMTFLGARQTYGRIYRDYRKVDALPAELP